MTSIDNITILCGMPGKVARIVTDTDPHTHTAFVKCGECGAWLCDLDDMNPGRVHYVGHRKLNKYEVDKIRRYEARATLHQLHAIKAGRQQEAMERHQRQIDAATHLQAASLAMNAVHKASTSN